MLSSASDDGIVIHGDDVCKLLAVDLSALQHKHLRMSPSKDLRMLHLYCAIANACVKQRVGDSICLSTMLFSHAYGAGQGMCHCVKAILRKQGLSHMHMIITICTSSVFCVGGLPRESASVLCASIFLLW